MEKGEKIGFCVAGFFSVLVTILSLLMAWEHNPQNEYSDNPWNLVSLALIVLPVYFFCSAFVLGAIFLLSRKTNVKITPVLGGILGVLSFSGVLMGLLFMPLLF